jgi:hypothetical protein
VLQLQLWAPTLCVWCPVWSMASLQSSLLKARVIFLGFRCSACGGLWMLGHIRY